MTLFEQTDPPTKPAEPWNSPPWMNRLIGLAILALAGVALAAAPFLPTIGSRVGRWVSLAPALGLLIIGVVVRAVTKGDLAACRVWRVAWDQLADDQSYRYLRQLHCVSKSPRGLVVGLRPPPPLTADELTTLGHQIASTEGLRLESARVIGRKSRQPAHVEFRFLR